MLVSNTALGQIEDAYNRLIDNALLLTRTELLEAAIRLGRQLGKSRRQIEGEAWASKLSVDDGVADFKLPGPDRRTIKAADYRGHVVLVCVWNPG